MLPQLNGRAFLIDSGMETTLVFHDGFDLRDFAAFELLEDPAAREHLADYYRRHADIALRHGAGYIFQTPTWRASADWGKRLGYDAAALDRINRESVAFLRAIEREYRPRGLDSLVDGCLGPRGDGYQPGARMSAQEARAYHAPQIASFANAGVDMVTAMTISYPQEAIGIALAGKAAGIPTVISFTLETDGRLPTGDDLAQTISAVDAATDGAPAYYMINCAHPDHFGAILDGAGPWAARLRGIRANASRMSHAELDEADVLDDGDPDELGSQYRALRSALPQLSVLGGCCGTDHRHIAAIGHTCLAA